jgi:hypothetical protein
MPGVSAGSQGLLTALGNRAMTELGTARREVPMTPGAELPGESDPKVPLEVDARRRSAIWRDPVANTSIDSTNAYTAAREIALLAAHERGVQRGLMSRMRCIAMYRLRLSTRTALLQRGVAEGLVPL